MDYHNLSIGQRITLYRKGKQLTATDLAEQVHVSQQLVDAWEHDKRVIQPQYIDDICSVLGVTSSELLRGVKPENETVFNTLGLSDESIEFLKSLQSRNHDHCVPFVETDDEPEDATNLLGIIFPDGSIPVSLEAGWADELRYVINLLLSDSDGKMLLSLIYKFVTVRFENAVVDGKDCFELEYYYDDMNRKTTIPVIYMRYALLQAINRKLEDLRNTVQEEN